MNSITKSDVAVKSRDFKPWFKLENCFCGFGDVEIVFKQFVRSSDTLRNIVHSFDKKESILDRFSKLLYHALNLYWKLRFENVIKIQRHDVTLKYIIEIKRKHVHSINNNKPTYLYN